MIKKNRQFQELHPHNLQPIYNLNMAQFSHFSRYSIHQMHMNIQNLDYQEPEIKQFQLSDKEKLIKNNVKSPCIVSHDDHDDPYTGFLEYYRPPPEGRKEYNGIYLKQQGTYHRLEVPDAVLNSRLINFDAESL